MRTHKPKNFLYSLVIVLARTAFKIFYQHKVYGEENIPSGGAILASNHCSFLDPPAVSISVHEQVYFLARKTLFKGWFGKFIWALNARPISGDVGDVKIFRELYSLLEAGGKLILFPEGTRSYEGELGKIRGGPFLIMETTQCAVVPVYLHGTGKIWGRDRKLPRLFGKTACIFGPPLQFDRYQSMEKKAAQQQFAEDLRVSILQLKDWYEKEMRPR